jgi:hypothetical protein
MALGRGLNDSHFKVVHGRLLGNAARQMTHNELAGFPVAAHGPRTGGRQARVAAID